MGEHFGESVTSWAYRYNQRNPTSGDKGVAHAAENWMMFKGSNTGFVRLPFPPMFHFPKKINIHCIYAPPSFNGSATFSRMTPTENAFAAELIAYWLSFVRSGDPNQYRLSRSPEWPTYKKRTSSWRRRIVLQQGPPRFKTTRVSSGSFVEEQPETDKTRCDVVASQVGRQQN
jgi:hypothetical protein